MTKVQGQKFVAIANKVGLTVVEQPSQFKVIGAEGRRFYIPGTKAVHKVELSGWSHELAVPWEAVYPGKRAPSPKITHILNFDQPEKLILKDFYKMAKSIALVEVPEEPEAETSEEPASEPVAAAS